MSKSTQHGAAADRVNVGIIGAGLVVQSIHIPVLQRLSDTFAVRCVWDVDHERSAALAAQLHAAAASSLEQLLSDESIDAVAICSPAAFHAEHALAAMRAGKRALLVEKPLCGTLAEVEAVAAMAAETGTALVMGSMHLYDPAWREATRLRGERTLVPRSISSNIVLPPNARFEQWAFEASEQKKHATGSAWTAASLMRIAIMELAIHDLPLVRRLLPEDAVPRVTFARLLEPFGYALTAEAGGVVLDLFCSINSHWQPTWTLEATGANAQLQISFTPSFVHAGSGVATWRERGLTIDKDPERDNGYVHEWRHLAHVLKGEEPRPDVHEFRRDYRFAFAVAEQACEFLASGGVQ